MEARALNNNNLLCYYTENDVSMKVRGRSYDSVANFTGKHLCCSLFLIKFKQTDSNTSTFP